MDFKETVKRARSSSGNSLQPPFNKQKMMDPASLPKTSTTNISSSSTSTVLFMRRETRYFTEEEQTELRSGTLSAGLWVGPMCPAMFLDRFLPQVTGPTARPGFSPEEFAKISEILDKATRYEAFFERLSCFSPGLKFIDASSSRCCLQTVINKPTAPEVDFCEAEIQVLFKYDDCDDPFSDDGGYCKATDNSSFPFERDNDDHCMTRGQMASCFSFLTEAQIRLHAFAVLVCGKWARILRWDPNGVIVTKRFAYSEEAYLVEFFWRYSQTVPNDRIRGRDPTVKCLPSIYPGPTAEEAEARIQLIESNKANHREFRTIMIPDRDTQEEYQFIISYPSKSISDSPFGRATRPMLTFDIDKNAMVFVKEYWRTVDDSIDKEGDIYKILHNANVPYISPFGRGNDIQDQLTITDMLKTEAWAHRTARMKPLRHYRMSLETIGRPSNKFKSSHELVTAVADAMEAHHIAFYDANILHRDISAGNILITEDGRGMLIDWDLCLNLNNPKNDGKSQRTGTWDFLSAMLLREPDHIQGILDDKESFLYVLLWNMMVYTPYNTSFRHSEEMELFEENRRGLTKQLFLLSKYPKLKFDGRPHLNALVRELSRTFKARYEDQDDISPEDREFWLSEEGLASYPNNPLAREKHLMDRFWILKTIRKYLEPRSEWPAADKPCKNPSTKAKTVY